MIRCVVLGISLCSKPLLISVAMEMFSGLKFDSACFTAALLVVVVVITQAQMCKAMGSGSDEYYCEASSCGHIHNISYPFRLDTDPPSCGKSSYELLCENNATLVLHLNSTKFHVQAINYENYTIRLVDADVFGGSDQYCSSFPPHLLTRYNFGFYDPYRVTLYPSNFQLGKTVTWMSCGNRMNKYYNYVDYSPCMINRSSTTTTTSTATTATPSSSYYYVKVGSLNASDLMASCRVEQMGMIAALWAESDILSLADLHTALVYGFEVSWYVVHCGNCSREDCSLYVPHNQIICSTTLNEIACPVLRDITVRVFFPFPKLHDFRWLLYPGHHFRWILHRGYDFHSLLHLDYDFRIVPYYNTPTDNGSGRCGIKDILRYFTLWFGIASIIVIELNIVLRIVCCIPFIVTILIRKLRRRHLSMFDDVEAYLKSQNNLMPIRYSYTQIKKMTRGFKDKLGEGGFGCVYRGKLRSGNFVAIKVLGKTKANGKEFINEVATIGRIHHFNVVKLIGYCAERSKRALVYDFMPNGSLEKYIFFRDDGIVSLSSEKLYQISIGVARGIEYLHQGCDVQILHFDIKPHNILLDENFTPKVSDFGLAKLYPTDDSIVSLTAARGTMGYMAPELFYKNIGGVSYKADVYSFGMLLLEMAGKRKNLNAFADDTSQIYFPSWAHNQISKGKDIKMGDGIELKEEKEMVKKMIIVALWCIQMNPCDRPSMHKVVEMLEGNIEVLQMPPKPSLRLEEMPVENSEEARAEIQSVDSIDSSTLDIISTQAPSTSSSS